MTMKRGCRRRVGTTKQLRRLNWDELLALGQRVDRQLTLRLSRDQTQGSKFWRDRHDSLTPDRLRKGDRVNPERVYLGEWKRECRRHHGGRLLALLLAPQPKQELFGSLPVPSHRDELVAATVVQWLGTNVGGAFVRACERRIAELRESEWRARGASWSRESLQEHEQKVEADRQVEAAETVGKKVKARMDRLALEKPAGRPKLRGIRVW